MSRAYRVRSGATWINAGLAALLLTGCRDEGARRLASETLLGLEADQVLIGVEMNLTRDGLRRGFLTADTVFSYQEQGRLGLRHLHITFYDDVGGEQGALSGREGEYVLETGDVQVNGSVEVVEASRSKRLVTERLRYDAAADSLYGDTAFVLYRPGFEMRGASFVSDARLENVRSRDPTLISDAQPGSAETRESP